jgi:hypothetical protein
MASTSLQAVSNGAAANTAEASAAPIAAAGPSTNAARPAAGPGAAPGGSGMGAPPEMHLDTTTGKWMFENPQTGEEFEWNEAANAWLPVVDDDLIKKQQAAYSVAGVDEEVSSFVTFC